MAHAAEWINQRTLGVQGRLCSLLMHVAIQTILLWIYKLSNSPGMGIETSLRIRSANLPHMMTVVRRIVAISTPAPNDN